MSRERHQWGKTQEFYAHDGPINCVSIGRQSCSVFVSGGDDKVVKVWKIGRPTPIMSLEGHTTEVDSVLFDFKETQVAAGSRGGGIKVWDLDTQQLIRTLPGHRASARCLDFHPYGDFFASGSDDTNIKIFDVRKKGCMQTYKGHAVGVSCVKHSPDGRWIVSGDMHGVVKVWDLSTGKIVTELAAQARSPVVSMDFHPHEFLLAVGGEQSTTIWDMETFSLVGTTPKESSTVRRVAFSKCGRSLISASSDALKTWNWDPSMAVQDAVEVGWGSGPLGGAGASNTASQVLADMTEGAVPGKELIGIARNKTILQVYICNISTMVPFNKPVEGEEPDAHAAPYQALLDTMPRVSIEESAPAPTFAAAPSTHQSILASPMKGFFDAHAASAAGGANGIQVAVPAGPNPYAKLEAQKAAAAAAQAQAQAQREREQQLQMKADREAAFAAASASQQQQPHYTPAPASSPVRPFQPSHPAQPFVPSQPAAAASSSAAAAAAVPYYAGASSSSHKASLAAERAQFQQQASSASTAASPAAQGAASFASQLPPATSKSDRPATAAAQPASAAAASAASSSSAAAAPAAAPSPKAAVSAHLRIEQEHPVMLKILRTRRENLQKLSALWGARGGALGGAKSCVSFVIALNDQAVTVDFLTFAEEVLSKGGVLTLDIARDLLPALKALLASKFENWTTTSLRYIRMLLQHFTGVIQSCRSAAALSGVDPTRDERLSRANDCYAQFKSIYDQSIAPLAKRNDAMGDLAKDTRAHLEKLLWTKP